MIFEIWKKLTKRKIVFFPFIYLVLVLLALGLNSDGLLFVLLAPTGLLLLGVELYLGTGQGSITGNMYLAFIAAGVPFLVAGFLWDWTAKYFRHKPYWP